LAEKETRKQDESQRLMDYLLEQSRLAEEATELNAPSKMKTKHENNKIKMNICSHSHNSSSKSWEKALIAC
jgi:hypothetical protein